MVEEIWRKVGFMKYEKFKEYTTKLGQGVIVKPPFHPRIWIDQYCPHSDDICEICYNALPNERKRKIKKMILEDERVYGE